MAFEQQLEADRIDDFNLFSAFVRVPLLILEGVLGQQEKDETNERLEDNCERSTLPPSSESKPQNENAPARTISNEDLSKSPTTQRTPLSRLETKSNQSLTRRSSHTSLNNLIGSPNGRKSRRKASWSDESGHNLVEYLDEVSYFWLSYLSEVSCGCLERLCSLDSIANDGHICIFGGLSIFRLFDLNAWRCWVDVGRRQQSHHRHGQDQRGGSQKVLFCPRGGIILSFSSVRFFSPSIRARLTR